MPQPMLILTNPQQQVRFRFSRETAAYQSSQQTHHYRWSQQERISNTPAYQYIGPGQQGLTLKGVIYRVPSANMGCSKKRTRYTANVFLLSSLSV